MCICSDTTMSSTPSFLFKTIISFKSLMSLSCHSPAHCWWSLLVFYFCSSFFKISNWLQNSSNQTKVSMDKIIINDDTCTQIITNFSSFIFLMNLQTLSSLKVEIRYYFARPLTQYLAYYKYLINIYWIKMKMKRKFNYPVYFFISVV